MKPVLLFLVLLTSFTSFAQLTPYAELDFWNESVTPTFLLDLKAATEDEKKEWLFEVLGSDEVADEDAKKLVGLLLDSAIVNADYRNKSEKASMFDVALRTTKLNTALMLIERGYNVNSRCFKCNAEPAIHKVLLRKDYDENGEMYVEILRALIDKGADLDLRDMDGRTPFHIIIDSKNKLAFDVFMEEGATFNYQNATLKGDGYLQYFDKKWDDDELREIMMEKTELKYPPTKKEIKKRQKELKAKQKEKKKSKNKESKD